jgi:hypothetical protein
VRQIKAIIGVLILMVGALLAYETLPAYWANFKVDNMIGDEAVYYTNFPKPPEIIAATVASKAQEYNVALTPQQVTVGYQGGDLTISVAYTEHIDFPGYPFDLNFKNSTTNKNVMK